jgi:hypothetical protein
VNNTILLLIYELNAKSEENLWRRERPPQESNPGFGIRPMGKGRALCADDGDVTAFLIALSGTINMKCLGIKKKVPPQEFESVLAYACGLRPRLRPDDGT